MRRLTLVIVLLLAPSGCKTRLYDLQFLEPARDGSTADFAAPTDLRVRDATIPPDLLPPPDLLRPPVCLDIWVVDADGTFSGFDTRTATFTTLKKLNCLSKSGPQTMAVDRNGIAWVLYSDGELFNVDVSTGNCVSTAFDPAQVNANMEMGSAFSADVPGGNAETYFVTLTAESLLVTIDPRLLKVSPIAALVGPAELTGTGDAELWGFFPGSPSSQVARIDKKTAALDRMISVPQVDSMSAGAFAFAFWGGSFWIFYAESGSDTVIYSIDRQSSVITAVPSASVKGRHILGAGASSCAPIGLDQ